MKYNVCVPFLYFYCIDVTVLKIISLQEETQRRRHLQNLFAFSKLTHEKISHSDISI